MNITIGADDLIDIPTFPLPTKIRVIIREKTRHQLLAGSDHSIGVGNSGVGVFGLVVGADMIGSGCVRFGPAILTGMGPP